MAGLPRERTVGKSLVQSKWGQFPTATSSNDPKQTSNGEFRISRLDQVKLVGNTLVYCPEPATGNRSQELVTSSQKTRAPCSDSDDSSHTSAEQRVSHKNIKEKSSFDNPKYVSTAASSGQSPNPNFNSSDCLGKAQRFDTTISNSAHVAQDITDANEHTSAPRTDKISGVGTSCQDTNAVQTDFTMNAAGSQAANKFWPRNNKTNRNPSHSAKLATAGKSREVHGNGKSMSQNEVAMDFTKTKVLDTDFSKIIDMNRNPRRSTKWATAAELRGDYGDRKSINPGSDKADFVMGHEAVAKDYGLADWTGGWAPAPVDWEHRGDFEDSVSADRIEAWKDACEFDDTSIDIGSEPDTMTSEIAPRSWIPISIENMTADAWYTMRMPLEIIPVEDEELLGLPWWRCYATSKNDSLTQLEVPVAGLDPTDNDMAKAMQQTSEHSRLSTHNTALRKRFNEKKLKAQQRAAMKEAEEYVPPPNKYAPAINIFIRPATIGDMPQIRDIYNYYIEKTIFCPEMKPLTASQVRGRWEDIVEYHLPFFVAIDASSKGNRNQPSQGQGSRRYEPVLGFVFADDYNDAKGMYRHTVEIDMFIKPSMLRKGIGRCLLDKVMSVLDPCCTPRAGYEFIGDELIYGPGGKRVIGSIIVNIPYDAKNKERGMWMQNWLCQWDFEQAGELFEVGRKLGIVVNQLILTKKTGNDIEPGAA